MRDNLKIKELVKTLWNNSVHLPVEERLSLCRHAICMWCKAFHENSQKSLEDVRERLDVIMPDLTPDEILIHDLNL